MMLATASKASFWMPPEASTFAPNTDFVFSVVLWISGFFFVLIVGVMLLFIIKYHRRPGKTMEKAPTHNSLLEWTWTVIPLLLVLWIFYLGFSNYVVMATIPDDALKIDVLGVKWNWSFEYPNGHIDGNLHVPANRDVVLTLSSDDVIHSLYIPAFRLKRDAVPGRYNKLWFNATKPGEYNIYCAEYCGTSHWNMLANCVVHPDEETYREWLENADPLKKLTPEQYEQYMADPAAFLAANPSIEGLQRPVDMGRQLYTRKGCSQCHSVDGTAGNGPSFKGIFQEDVQMADGSTVTVDENYMRESMLDPMAKVVAGFQPVMPTYQGRLKPREIDAIIKYIKSLKEE